MSAADKPVLISPTISGTMAVQVGRGSWSVAPGSLVVTSVQGTVYVVPRAPEGQPRRAHVLLFRDGGVKEIQLGDALAQQLAQKVIEAGPDAIIDSDLSKTAKQQKHQPLQWVEPGITGPVIVAVGSGTIRIPADAEVVKVTGKGPRAMAHVIHRGIVHVLGPRGEAVLDLGEGRRLAKRWETIRRKT